MFLFRHNKPIDLSGFTDCHSHILPGVDDGVQKLSDSLQILGRYEELGIREVVFTPHVMADVPNTTEGLRARFEAFRGEYKGGIKLHLAAEYMLDTLFLQRLADGDLLTHGDGNRVLVETSYLQPPSGLNDIFFNIQTSGYEIILAHPERYMYMEMSEYDKLRDKGIMLQMNLGSLAGMYGTSVQKRALHLLKGGYYSIAGSDIHNPRMISHYLEVKLDAACEKAFAAIREVSI